MLKKLIRSNLDDLWLYIGVEGGLFLLLEVIICCVMYFERPEYSVSVAWTMFPIVAGFISLCAVSGHVAVTFDLALRFGQTRRRAMGQFLGMSVFESAFGFALAALLSSLDRFACPALWARLAGLDSWVMGEVGAVMQAPLPDILGMDIDPGRYFVNTAGELTRLPENTLLVDGFSLDWYWWLIIFAAALAGGIIIGALIQRFGQKGLWVVWCLTMVPLFMSQIFSFHALRLPYWLGTMLFPLVAGTLAAGLFLWALWSMFHAVVRT